MEILNVYENLFVGLHFAIFSSSIKYNCLLHWFKWRDRWMSVSNQMMSESNLPFSELICYNMPKASLLKQQIAVEIHLSIAQIREIITIWRVIAVDKQKRKRCTMELRVIEWINHQHSFLFCCVYLRRRSRGKTL